MTGRAGLEVETLTIRIPDAAAAPGRPKADHDARGRAATGTEAEPRRNAGQGARPRAPLAASDRKRAGEVDHGPRRAGGRDQRVCLPVAPAHLPGARHRRGNPGRAAAEGVEASRCAREWTACLERPEGDLGLQHLTRSCSERFGLGAAQLVLKLKQTAGQRESQPACPVMHGSSHSDRCRGTAGFSQGAVHPAVTPVALLFAGRLRRWRGLPAGGSGANP
jgi:hypothetical protein